MPLGKAEKLDHAPARVPENLLPKLLNLFG